jgi:hypothetical protein
MIGEARTSTIARLVAGSLAFACACAAGAQGSFERRLAEVRKQLSVDGRPINPRAIQDLLPIVSDPLPGPVAIDLSTAVHSNRYYGEVRKHDTLGALVELGRDADGSELGWIAYRSLGRLHDGRHVVLVHENGGGSLVSVMLLLLDFVPDSVLGENGQPIRRVLMRNRGMITLGDRYAGEVRVRADHIEIGADPRSREPAKVIRIR